MGDEDDLALDNEKHQIGSALPWDHARGASKAAWSEVNGMVSPRDPTRGCAAVFNRASENRVSASDGTGSWSS